MPIPIRSLVTGPDDPRRQAALADWGLLILRVSAGALMLGGHGWGKLTSFSSLTGVFPDPLGVGSAASLTLAVFAEVFCAAAVVLGLATRLATVPLIVTMLVAILVVHGADPWAKKEFAMLYLVPYVTILLAGPGRLAVDNLIRDRR